MNQETKQFIAENKDKDIHQLALQSCRYPLIDIPLAIRQIGGRQKIKSKVPRFYNTEDILYPAQLSLEQSSSESTAIYKSLHCEGKSLVDLTGGFGVDCCFMATHFKQVTYIERQVELCELAIHNFKELGEKNIKVIHTETEKYLSVMEPVDWIFIDPARRSTIGKKVVLLSDCEPNIAKLSSLLIEKASNVMIKLSPMMDISAAMRDIPQINEIHIVAVENECKEILLILSRSSSNNKKIIIRTINFVKNNQKQEFHFKVNEEMETNSKFTSEIEKYLYEPNAAVMKSGAFKLIGNSFGLHKLHKNTHLYTSNELLHNFPGRKFEVKSVCGNSKVELKNLAQRIPKANISTRNYPINVDELRQKLKIKDGGDSYLFACTLDEGKKVIIECKKKD